MQGFYKHLIPKYSKYWIYIHKENILPDSIQTVLTSAEVNLITRETAKIKKKLYRSFSKKNKGLSYHDYALDIEFKIYDEEMNCIGIAKIAKPVKKTPERDFTFKLKVDFL